MSNEPTSSTSPKSPSQEPPAKPPLSRDLARIVPVWVLLMAVAIGALLWLRSSGSRLVERLAYTSPNARDLALTWRGDGAEGWRRAAQRVAQLRAADPSTTTTAILRNDPELRKAREALEKSLTYSSEFPDVTTMLADLALWGGNESEAWVWRGRAALRAREFERALMNFDVASSLTLPQAEIETGRLEALIGLNRLEAATTMTLHWNPELKTAQYHWLRAELARRKGDFTVRAEALKDAVAKDVTLLPAVKDLAAIYHHGGQNDAARDLYERATKAIANDANLWHRYAIFARSIKDGATEERALRAGLAVSPNSPVLNKELGEYYVSVNDSARASRYLRRATELDPSVFAAANTTSGSGDSKKPR